MESGGLKSEIKLVRKGCENDLGRHGEREREINDYCLKAGEVMDFPCSNTFYF